jgi:hypothetical protein
MTKKEKYVNAYLDGYYSEKIKDYYAIQTPYELEKIIKRAEKKYKKNIKIQKLYKNKTNE